MAMIFLRHAVADYDTWRPHYDGDLPRREEAGLTEVGVFRDAGDPNLVLLAWSADSLGGFEAMLESPELKAKMEAAGVTSPPEVWIAD